MILMAVKTNHDSSCPLHFVTFTCFRWINLFEMANAYQYVYKWFEYLREKKQINVVSYVIMPNHLHLILNLSPIKTTSSLLQQNPRNLNMVVGNGKRFLAYEIINALERMNRHDILDLLYDGVTQRQRNKGQKHRVFEASFDAKPIYSQQFLYQKIDYIHHNPLRGKWQLVKDYSLYLHSSASFYEHGKSQLFEPVHYEDL